jgi:hypothetical protein
MLYESDESRSNRLALWRTMAPAAIPLPELLALGSVPPDRGALFYQQSHALVTFLHGLGDDHDWTVFLDAFGRGELETAVQRAYGIDSLAMLERRWLEHEGVKPAAPAEDDSESK